MIWLQEPGVEGAGAEGRFACHCAVQSSLLEGRICDDRINRGNRKFGRRPNVILRIGRHSRHWDLDRRRMLRWKEKFEWLVALLMWMLLHCLKVKTLPWLKSYHRARCPGRSPGHPPSCPLRRHPLRFILLLSLCLPAVISSLTYFLFFPRRAVLLEDAWAGPKVGRVAAAD